MIRYNLVDGVLVEDENGEFIKLADHTAVINTIKAQLEALNAYSVVLQSYVDTLL